MMHKTWLTFFLLLFCSIASSQSGNLEVRDRQLADSFATLYYSMDSADLVRDDLRMKIGRLLKNEASFDFAFDSLSQKMNIIVSDDQKLKIYSWDQVSGGTWHDMYSIAQFKTASGKTDTLCLVTGHEAEYSTHTDVINYEIHELSINSKTYYLVFGFGTHGSGHHHKIAQIFSIENEKLVKCTTCFEGQSELVIAIPRVHKISLKYDAQLQTITYDEFIDEEDTTFEKPTGKKITLQLKNGVFVKK